MAHLGLSYDLTFNDTSMASVLFRIFSCFSVLSSCLRFNTWHRFWPLNLSTRLLTSLLCLLEVAMLA